MFFIRAFVAKKHKSMKIIKAKFVWTIGFLTLCFYGCMNKAADLKHSAAEKGAFNNYWYQGKAEITSYTLEQERYGEIHSGYAVLIFVTEDFSKSKHVKLDNPETAGEDAVKVLKLNTIKKFTTGIYPYSMMNSVFTPVEINEFPHSLKTTSSSQEWCGHTFTQFDLQDSGYDVLLHSYFESEGEQKVQLKHAWLEDEIWTRIRINYETLPTGNIEIIPGGLYQRLSHQKFEKEKASASLNENGGQMIYELKYEKTGRTLKIYFNKAFPHEITSWEETRKSGWGENAKTLTTKAIKNKTLFTDYWHKNKAKDVVNVIKEISHNFEKEFFQFKLLKSQMQKKLMEKFEEELDKERKIQSEKLEGDGKIYQELKENISEIIKKVNRLGDEINKFIEISQTIKKEDFEMTRFANKLREMDKEKLDLMRKLDTMERLVSKMRRHEHIISR